MTDNTERRGNQRLPDDALKAWLDKYRDQLMKQDNDRRNKLKEQPFK